MQISLPSLIFEERRLHPIFWYDVKKGWRFSYPPWFFMKDLNYRYIYIAWKDADFLPSLIFLWKFELTLSWYSMKGCGFPYPPWFFKKTDCTPYLIPVWCEKKDGDFLTLLDFLMKDLNYCFIYIAWKDADFPTFLDFFGENLNYRCLKICSMKGCGFPCPPWFLMKLLSYSYIDIA